MIIGIARRSSQSARDKSNRSLRAASRQGRSFEIVAVID
jgi:hypothetical protein